MHQLKLTYLLTILLIVLTLSSCANSNQEAEAPPVADPVIVEETPPTEPITTKSEFIAPLTGLSIEEPSNVRPLTVMVNNAPAARPQSGLSQADMVYEVLAEGGITRLVAIYQSHNEEVTIGPIRSIRPYLIELGDLYNGLLVHAGGSPEAYSIIQKEKKEDLDEIGKAGAFFWRDKSRKAPHNLYSDITKLRAGADKLNYEKEVKIPTYPFRSEDEIISGEHAKKVDITFLLKNYVVSYEYDDTNKLYKRSINGKPHLDLTNDKQLETANVIVMSADHEVLDDVGRISVDINSGGDAFIFQKGTIIRGNWIHAKDDVIRFMKDDKEIPLVPGTTYINIVPNDPSLENHVTISGTTQN